jgi:aryl-alcohol dehydrogenase-like predicted oxidoreductase
MTFGVQNSASDAFAQMEYARSVGCNFIDTAELYPVPLTAPEYRAGATEEILGQYISQIGSSQRDELVIATKIAGYFPNSPVAAARSYPDKPFDPAPDCRLDATSLRDAVHASLRRLQTDRIELLQIHWPDRYIPVFGQSTFNHDSKRSDDVPILETATALKELIDEGKIRYIGLSNESTFGVCEWVNACKQLGIEDKLCTIQNSYSLLDRRFDSELAEACDAHNIGLLPWSVLAGGLLSGKYNKKYCGKSISSDSNSRFVRFPDYMRRWHPASASQSTLDATEEYAKIAEDAGMTPSELAIAFVRSRRFVKDNGSVIVGATTLEQLKENMGQFDGKDVSIIDEILEKIDEIHLRCRDPSCSL